MALAGLVYVAITSVLIGLGLRLGRRVESERSRRPLVEVEEKGFLYRYVFKYFIGGPGVSQHVVLGAAFSVLGFLGITSLSPSQEPRFVAACLLLVLGPLDLCVGAWVWRRNRSSVET
jgi:hypothetical protein